MGTEEAGEGRQGVALGMCVWASWSVGGGTIDRFIVYAHVYTHLYMHVCIFLITWTPPWLTTTGGSWPCRPRCARVRSLRALFPYTPAARRSSYCKLLFWVAGVDCEGM